MIALLKKYFYSFIIPQEKIVKKTKRKYTKRLKAQNIIKNNIDKQIVLENINDVKNNVFDTNTIIKFLSICKKIENKKYAIHKYIPDFRHNNYNVQVIINPNFDYKKCKYDKREYFCSLNKNFCEKNFKDDNRLNKLCKIATKYLNIDIEDKYHITNHSLLKALVLNKNYNFYKNRKLFFTNKYNIIKIENEKLFFQNGNFKLNIDIKNLLTNYINN